MARALAGVVGVVMAAALTYGFTAGDFFADGGRLIDNPWGVVTLVEVYVGYAILAVWMVYREPSALSGVLWVIALMLIGHLVSAVYLLRAAATAKGDLHVFWNGRRQA